MKAVIEQCYSTSLSNAYISSVETDICESRKDKCGLRVHICAEEGHVKYTQIEGGKGKRMKNLKLTALIGISLLALGSVVYINTWVLPVSAATIASGDYIWLGGYLNNTLTLVNLTDGTVFAHTVMNTSWDYWEDSVNYTFTDGSPFNVICPKEQMIGAPSAIYSTELSESMGVGVWYSIALQWRPATPDGYGKYGDIDVDYVTFANQTDNTKFAVTPTGTSTLTSDGAWIGDGTNDGPGNMWCLQTLFVNVTAYLGGPPGEELIAVPLVNVDMDNWMTTGSAYANVSIPGHPLDGIEASATGAPWESPYKSAVTVGAGAEINSPGLFIHPLSLEETPLNVSIVFAQKQMIGRSDLLLPGDATMDGYANVLDLGRMSDWWLWDSTSKAYGELIGDLESTGQWAQSYKVSKEVNSLDFNGDEFVNVVDLGILSDHWLESGWSPPTPM